MVCAKRYEVLSVIALKMRELSPIKGLRHGGVGTAALGCPQSEAPLGF